MRTKSWFYFEKYNFSLFDERDLHNLVSSHNVNFAFIKIYVTFTELQSTRIHKPFELLQGVGKV